MEINVRGLKKLLDISLFNPVNVIQVIDYHNVYDEKNIQVEITPLYRVLFASSCKGSNKYTIITEDYDLRSGVITDICFKKLPHRNFQKKKKYEEWKDKIIGEVCISTPKADIKKFIKLLRKDKKWDWFKLVDLLVDGTGMMDQRLKDLMKATYIPLPLKNYETWQGINNHSLVISNSRIGKTASFKRLNGISPSKHFTEPGLLGTIAENGGIREGALSGTGVYAFDEFPKFADKTGEVLIPQLLNYMNNGEGIRDMSVRVQCIGTKCLLFFGNVPNKWDLNSFKQMLVKLAGHDSLDALGTRTGHVLYGDNFGTIRNTDNIDINLINRIRYLIETMVKEKKGDITYYFKRLKKWIEMKDPEYEAYIEDLMRYSEHRELTQFLKGFKYTSSRLKCGAIKMAILEHLPELFFRSKKALVKSIKNRALYCYYLLKNHNYKSFEFLFHNKKAQALNFIKQGYTYNSAVLSGLKVTRPTYNMWRYEYNLSLKDSKLR